MTAKTNFRGSFTALVTPFKNGALDERRSASWWTGRSPRAPTAWCRWAPPARARRSVMKNTRWSNGASTGHGRVPVIAGTGSNSTAEAVELSRACRESGRRRCPGCDPLLQQADPGRALSAFQGDQRRHRHSDHHLQHSRPLDRRYVGRDHEAAVRLKNIAGVKDATANMSRVSQQRAAMGQDLIQLSGEDGTALGFMAHGGHGCISVTSNVAPRLCAEFQSACLKGDFAAGV